MAGIEELVGGDPRPHQTQFNEGVWARVNRLDGDVVEIVIPKPAFDGDQVFADVKFVMGGTGTGTPAEGDTAFLHMDGDGHPAYAVVWK